MNPVDIMVVESLEQQGVAFLDRIEGNNGQPITKATMSAITYKVFDKQNNNTVTGSGTVDINTCVFDTLQTKADDPRWSKDAIGFNFAHQVPASAFPNGGHQYRVEYLFRPQTGEQFWKAAQVNAQRLFTNAT